MGTRPAGRNFFQRILLELILPLTLLVAVSLVFRFFDLDLRVEGYFFVPEAGWIYQDRDPWDSLYHYGILPVILTGLGALLVYVASFRWAQLRGYRSVALFLVLLGIIGPIGVVNLVFKEHWGRPRPCEVVQFGGEKRYLHVWQKGVSGQGRSFPCGHCSAGFFFIGLLFVMRPRSRRWAAIALAFALGYGALMGIARMVQGGHFPTDVLWSAGFMYLCSLGLYYLLGLHRDLGGCVQPASRTAVTAANTSENGPDTGRASAYPPGQWEPRAHRGE